MSTQEAHSSDRQYQSSTTGAVTTLLIEPSYNVTYNFEAELKNSSSIPYAVAINGVAKIEYAKKNRRVTSAGGKFTVEKVKQGQVVSLFLNSDASPAWRKQPVYAVTVSDHDVEITITEKTGKCLETDKLTLKQHANPTVGAKNNADIYSAFLTGDIWMRVSHKYTPEEVESRLPNGTSAVVKAAVSSIYQGLREAELSMSEPGIAGKPPRTLAIDFKDSDNPNDNINKYTLRADGLPRVHPAGYAALFTAALENNITSITVSSCWRPMLGSIVHRIGLGLDVSILGGTVLNRQELRHAFAGKVPTGQGNHDDKDNVTDAEVTAFGKYEEAIKVKKAAEKAENQAKKANKADKQIDSLPKTDAAAKLATANSVTDAASADMRAKEAAWDKTRNDGEPAHASLFRASLLKCTCVGQLFDPWYMSSDAHSGKTISNKQQSGLEILHAHHLHITIDDSTIL